MKKILFVLITLLFSAALFTIDASSKNKGDKCISDGECGFGLECSDGVCTKDNKVGYSGSGKSGKPCNNDSDCIGSGQCEKNNFGKGVCTGD
jgi:hypothetical protein